MIEQISEAKFIDNPIIAINVDDGLVKIEHNDNVVLVVVASHVSRKPEEICVFRFDWIFEFVGLWMEK